MNSKDRTRPRIVFRSLATNLAAAELITAESAAGPLAAAGQSAGRRAAHEAAVRGLVSTWLGTRFEGLIEAYLGP